MITTSERQEQLIDLHEKLMNPSQARMMREAGLGIIESRREGPYVWDEAGTRYIDCRQETSVFNVGRRNPELVEKLKLALDEFDLGNSLFFSEPRVRLAQRLGEISPGGKLRAVTFGVSGGEVNDFALKLARAQTDRRQVIAMKNGYHGSTAFAASASGDSRFRAPFAPLVGDIVYADFGSVASLEALIDDQTACVILESVQTLAGVRIPPKGYLAQVRRLCDQSGALMIVDENETCLGRTGSMFAIDSLGEGVVPDILTLGKSLGAGLFPISAAIYRDEYLSFWERYPFSHLSTFGGSDLGCVMGFETISYVKTHHLSQAAASRGSQLAKAFKGFLKKYPAVLKSFRHLGLSMAVEFQSDDIGPQMSRDLSQFGVLASCSPIHPATMFLLPSLTISEDDVDLILEAFEQTLTGSQAILSPRKIESFEQLLRL